MEIPDKTEETKYNSKIIAIPATAVLTTIEVFLRARSGSVMRPIRAEMSSNAVSNLENSYSKDGRSFTLISPGSEG